MSLYPTPTRLALLGAIARGEVYGAARQWWDGHEYRVTARVRELQRAGWVESADPPGCGSRGLDTTAAGRAVLTTAGRCCQCGTPTRYVKACECVITAGDPPAMHDGDDDTFWCGSEDCQSQLLCRDCWLALGDEEGDR